MNSFEKLKIKYLVEKIRLLESAFWATKIQPLREAIFQIKHNYIDQLELLLEEIRLKENKK